MAVPVIGMAFPEDRICHVLVDELDEIQNDQQILLAG